jgi:single-strand DNA-binding protein
MTFQQVIVMGRLGGDPEVRTIPNGQQVANFSVATGEKWKDKDGKAQEKTEWHKLVCWGATAELAGKYLKKGDMAQFIGKLQTRMWEKDGQKHYSTEINCSQIVFTGGGSRSDGGAQGSAAPSAGSNLPSSPAYDEDVPFN